MRGIVAKRLRANAEKIAKPSQLGYFQTQKKKNIKGKIYTYITRIFKYEGYRRIYQDLKKKYVNGG